MNSTCELGDDAARALKPYPAYKDSGVEWLGDVPAHWEVLRLKQICRLAYGDALADAVRRDGAVQVLGSNGRVGFHDSANTKAPCIVIGRKGSFGKVNYSPDPAFAIDTTFFVDSRFSSANIRWLFFLLRWLRLDEVTRDSAVPGLDREDTYQRPGVLPPLSEQAAIVRFLDHADRRIRRYIRAQQQLIALLEEKKQAIIHRAVTRGLDPNVRLKDSGVPWLGDVPVHWEVLRLKQICRLAYGDALADAVRRDGAVQVLGSNGRVGFHDSANTKAPCIVIGRKGSFGKVNYSPDPAFAIDTTFFVDSRFSSANIRWLFFLLRWLRLDEVTRDSAVPGLDREDTYQRPGVLPPLSEQAAIVSFLDRTTAALDAATTSAQRETSLLREYHTRLIADVVTGKFDVREAAARLPDEVEELEPLDEADALIGGEEEPIDALATAP